MSTRQAISEAILRRILLAIVPAFLVAISACTTPSKQQISPTPTVAPPTGTPAATSTVAPTPTSTPLTCLTLPGRVEESQLDEFTPPQEFRMYLPPCYDEKTDQRYPVLYLLHGQTYTDDQWVRLGAVKAVDQLSISGESAPFIMVFPDDRYWNLEAGPGFGDRLVNALIPHIDATYRTIPDREHRAIGGMSRGAAWALRLGLTRWDLFGVVGLHSLAASQKDISNIADWLTAIPSESRPMLFMDMGDADPGLALALGVENEFNQYSLTYEWHLYNGDHTEPYWSAHVNEYIDWYADHWDSP